MTAQSSRKEIKTYSVDISSVVGLIDAIKGSAPPTDLYNEM
jgi:hypothetical protein